MYFSVVFLLVFLQEVYKYSDIGAIGIDVWQVKSGTIFDNVLITDDLAEAEAAIETFKTMVKGEAAMKKKADDEADAKRKAEEEAAKAAEQDVEEDEDDDDEEEAAAPQKDEL